MRVCVCSRVCCVWRLRVAYSFQMLLSLSLSQHRSRLVVRSTTAPPWWLRVTQDSRIAVGTSSGVNSFSPTKGCSSRTQWLHFSVKWGVASPLNTVSVFVDGIVQYQALLPLSTAAFEISFTPNSASDSSFILSRGSSDNEIQTITKSLQLWSLELWRDDSLVCLCSTGAELVDCLDTVQVSEYHELRCVCMSSNLCTVIL